MVVEGPDDTWKVVRTMMGATNPREAAPGTIRGDLALETHREPRARLRRTRVGRARDRAVLPRISCMARDRAHVPRAGRAAALACREADARLAEACAVPEPWFSSVVGRDMAVDLGTANTLVYVRGQRHRAQRAVGRRRQHAATAARSRSASRPSG